MRCHNVVKSIQMNVLAKNGQRQNRRLTNSRNENDNNEKKTEQAFTNHIYSCVQRKQR